MLLVAFLFFVSLVSYVSEWCDQSTVLDELHSCSKKVGDVVSACVATGRWRHKVAAHAFVATWFEPGISRRKSVPVIQIVLLRGLAFVWYLCDTVLDVRHSSFPGESEVWRARVLSSATESLETEFLSRYPSVTSRAWTISPARVSFTTLDALDTALSDDPGVGTLARSLL